LPYEEQPEEFVAKVSEFLDKGETA
jgi:hypothetical protein